MDKIQILWADDEIDLLKPYQIFLEEKGFSVTTANNGIKAIELIQEKHFDIVFLDESMPGLSGLETLSRIKAIRNDIPVVMITKNEAESIMEDAIGSQIADYLIKPVNPNQILLSLKKTLENKRLVSEKTGTAYMQEFRNIFNSLNERLDFAGWIQLYRKIVHWELELDKTGNESMRDMLLQQKSEANRLFFNFVQNNYQGWLKQPQTAPLLSHNLFKEKVFPVMENTSDPVFFILIDNLRFDQWKVLQPLLNELFRPESEDIYCGILPTATQYARNAIFSGMMPADIAVNFPALWLNDEVEGGKNLHEEEFVRHHVSSRFKEAKVSYTKITHLAGGKAFADQVLNLMHNKLNVVVYNFVDALSHARTDTEVIRELADDEVAYRSLTLSWFQHSPLLEALRKLSEKKVKVIISTDHGTIRVTKPSKVVGEKTINTNLRYKNGRNLSYDKRDVYEVRNPSDIMLPKSHLISTFIFAKEDSYFVYPNNFNHFANYYKNTFQHGGISLEEMLIPIITLSGRG